MKMYWLSISFWLLPRWESYKYTFTHARSVVRKKEFCAQSNASSKKVVPEASVFQSRPFYITNVSLRTSFYFLHCNILSRQNVCSVTVENSSSPVYAVAENQNSQFERKYVVREAPLYAHVTKFNIQDSDIQDYA